MKRLSPTLIILLSLLLLSNPVYAFWVWTPESNKWTNPKYSVKETPSEQLDFGLSFYKSQQYKEAIREFQKLIKHYPRAREAPEAQYHIGLSWEDQANLSEAFKQYQVVVEKYPFSERSSEIVKRQYLIAEKLLETGNDKGLLATFKSDYDIIEMFRTIIKNAPYGEYAAQSQYKIGLYLMEKRLYQDARDEFEKVVNDYPSSEWAKAAQYQIAVSDSKRSTEAQYDQQVTKSAVDEFHEFVKNNPDAELTNKAKEQIQSLREKEAENNFVIAQFYEKQRNYKAALLYYQTVVDDYKESSFAGRALERLREVSSKQ